MIELQQIREALESVEPYADQFTDYSATAAEWPANLIPRKVVAALAALSRLEAAAAPVGEVKPVAWMYTSKLAGNQTYITRYATDLSTYEADKVTPLYTTPPAPPEGDARAAAFNEVLALENTELGFCHDSMGQQALNDLFAEIRRLAAAPQPGDN